MGEKDQQEPPGKWKEREGKQWEKRRGKEKMGGGEEGQWPPHPNLEKIGCRQGKRWRVSARVYWQGERVSFVNNLTIKLILILFFL